MKTKSKLYLNLLAGVVFIFSGKAQVTGGIVGGVSTGAVKIENVGKGLKDVLQGNNILGFEAGIFAKLNLSVFYIKPMALYNFSTGNINSTTEANSGQTINFMMHRLETPLLFGFKIIGPLSVEAGPVYNYIIKSNDMTESIAQGSGIGYRVGLGLEIKRLLINASYGGVTVNSNGLNNATFKEPYKIVFSLGFKLHKQNKEKSGTN
jgi:hypothetical protein